MARNPIVQRELIGVLRTRRALAMLVGLAVVFGLLVLLRWPTDARVEISGAASRQVFRLFAYALATALILFAPVFAATAIVRERRSGTLALLLNSPLSPSSIYFGKFAGVLGFTGLLLAMSLPAAAACYAMGGVALAGNLLAVYGLLILLAVEMTALGLLVSSYAGSADSATRITYGIIVVAVVAVLAPHLFFQGGETWVAKLADWLRCLSPIPAVMEVAGQGDVGGQGLLQSGTVARRFALIAGVASLVMAGWTIIRLHTRLLDRARPQGVITDERSLTERSWRRIFFLFFFDPQRRTGGIGPLTNPVMVKEFRCRRFGRSHWLMRLAAASALISLLLTYAATSGTMDWGVETIGGIMVVLQMALIVLITPSLAAGLVSSERESGSWVLLQMTPMSAGKILRGKLWSVALTLLLILVSTLPGYIFMVYIQPEMWLQISRVVICLLLTAAFCVALSAAASSLFRRTAAATTFAYAVLLAICAGTLLFWIGRDAPFGHSTVEAALTVNPLAAALSIIRTPGFTRYDLLPANWWFLGSATLLCLGVLWWRVRRLIQPT